MKNILLSSAALAGLVLVSAAPAAAQEPALQLGVAGYTAGYAVYTGGDNMQNMRRFDFRKHSEIYLTGEVALDNGITAGAHFEISADRANQGVLYNSKVIQESYMYLSSSWGRINFGEEDGAAYLLQVAAPSADDNIDGLRPIIGTIGLGQFGGYAQDPFGYTNKFTYITPVFNGFQAAASYAPQADTSASALGGLAPLAQKTGLENGWEIAARYEGSFDAVDLAIGAGYSAASMTNPTFASQKSLKAWNVGANLNFGAFGVGAAYVHSNEAYDNADVRTWVGGVDYKIAAYKLGLSYQNYKADDAAAVARNIKKFDQWTAGAVYEWGPGMTFRGAVQYVDGKDSVGAKADRVQVTLGTQLNF